MNLEVTTPIRQLCCSQLQAACQCKVPSNPLAIIIRTFYYLITSSSPIRNARVRLKGDELRTAGVEELEKFLFVRQVSFKLEKLNLLRLFLKSLHKMASPRCVQQL